LGLYISFFPQLLSGPVVCYSTIEKQLSHRKLNWDMISSGICRFVEGLLKKILLADNLEIVVEHIFALSLYGNAETKFTITLAWLGALANVLQVYYYFSAYSDMAIGLGKMFGFYFPENFNYPFISKSIKEFTTRWYISITQWFEQYIYQPLGGDSDENKDKMLRNLLIVWLLTGIWYGSSWNFICWGLFIFIFIILETLIQIEKIKGYDLLRHIYVIFVVILAMVIFRCEDNFQLVSYMRCLFGLSGNTFYSPTVIMFLKEYGIVFLFAILFIFPLREYVEKRVNSFENGRMIKVYHVGYVISMFALLIFSLSVLKIA
jgi:alginate O-acetyltransferase complex protein AlgI